MGDDAELMRRVACGDTGAFHILVENHQKGIYNFFLRSTGRIEDAEDLTQQLFINLFRAAHRYRPTASFKTYIYKIAANMAVSFARMRKRKTAVSLDEMKEEGYEPVYRVGKVDPVAFVEEKELEEAYVRALVSLPQDWRTAIELKVGRGFSYKEIAEVMGKSVSAVESIIFRARERLADELKRFRGEDEG